MLTFMSIGLPTLKVPPSGKLRVVVKLKKYVWLQDPLCDVNANVCA
jgi:hypothetical protein